MDKTDNILWQVKYIAKRNWLQARRDLLIFRVGLCRALGGSWTRGLQPESIVAVETGDSE